MCVMRAHYKIMCALQALVVVVIVALFHVHNMIRIVNNNNIELIMTNGIISLGLLWQ